MVQRSAWGVWGGVPGQPGEVECVVRVAGNTPFPGPSSFLGEICKAGVIKNLRVSFQSLWLGRAGGIAGSEERGCPG